MSTTASRRHSTQAERRAETQAALLDATIECLVTYGYAKTTTGRIAELAGVSRGAQLPYFRSRIDIVTAAVSHLADKRIAEGIARLGDKQVTLEGCLDALWDAHQGPLFDATLELWVASRTDVELRAALHRVERRVGATMLRMARSALGPQAERPGFAEDLLVVLATIRGLALLRVSNGTGRRSSAETWRQTRERLVRLLA